MRWGPPKTRRALERISRRKRITQLKQKQEEEAKKQAEMKAQVEEILFRTKKTEDAQAKTNEEMKKDIAQVQTSSKKALARAEEANQLRGISLHDYERELSKYWKATKTIMDGLNAGYSEIRWKLGKNAKYFEIKKVFKAMAYYNHREVIADLKDHVRRDTFGEDLLELERLQSRGQIIFAEAPKNDDLAIIQRARDRKLKVITKDYFWDWINLQKTNEDAAWISTSRMRLPGTSLHLKTEQDWNSLQTTSSRMKTADAVPW